MEKELGKKFKALRSDNGGEYVSNKFKNFCAVEGIKWELTKLHNPQQNRVAEIFEILRGCESIFLRN